MEIRTGRLAGVGSWELDLPGQRVVWSELARALHEVPLDAELTLDSAIDLYRGEARQALKSAIEGAISSGTSWDLELPLFTASGRALWIRSMGMAELDRGELILLGGGFQDVTSRHRADEALQNDLPRAADSAEQRTRAAQLNHDVRTPIGTVMGLSYLLARTSLSGDQRALLDKMDAAVNALIQLLDHARATAGVKVEDGDVAMPGRLASTVRAFGVTAACSSQDDQPTLRPTYVDSAVVARLPGVHILIADDSQSYLEAARKVLEQEGARVWTVLDGSQAVKLLGSTSVVIDAVLLDVQMPVLDGVAATRLIRGDLGLAHLPLIAMTGDAQSGACRRALDAGMNGIISKPFQPDALVVLLVHELARARHSRAPPDARVPRESASITDWPSIEGIDGPDVQQRLRGDLPFFTRLLRGLCNEFADLAFPPPYPEFAGNRAALAGRLHKLGGNASLIGASILREAAATGEAAIRGGSERADASVALARVGCSMHQLLRASAPWLTQSERSLEGDPAPVPLDQALLTRWQAQLRSRDFDALARFEELSPGLRLACGSARFEMLRSAMERLDLESALALVSQLKT